MRSRPRARHRLGLATAAALSALALSVTGCSTGPAGGEEGTAASSAPKADADAFPVTIEHTFGETTIPEQPERVATVSWVNDDVAIALGVVPVGMPTIDWGGNDNGSTPWKDAALKELDAGPDSDDYPTQYSEADGVNFTEIAKTEPDVILATYSGLTQDEYDKLSKIAPVVAYPDLAYGTPWQKSTEMIGQALGLSEKAEKLVDDTEQSIQDAAAKYPQLEGKTFISGTLDPDRGDGVSLYTANDNRPRFLTSLGMTLAPVVEKASKGSDDFYISWSNERADELDSDIFISWADDEEAAKKAATDPLLKQIPAIENDALVTNTDNATALSISASSPLSLPWALKNYLPTVAEAASAADENQDDSA